MNRIASVLAFVIGAMAVFAGGKVLLGILPDYYVINWLPVYNYTVGILTVFVTAALIWVGSKLARPVATTTLGIHILVMLVLLTVYQNVVAIDSIVAMTVRIAVWLVILGLMFLQMRRTRQARVFNLGGFAPPEDRGPKR
ncbi:MAG: hypothetical protein FIB03_16080 [Anaerolineae bacterium]|nr:hypothetical protein [Anaerolineae bacterium]